jgi:hypothetical protein
MSSAKPEHDPAIAASANGYWRANTNFQRVLLPAADADA